MQLDFHYYVIYHLAELAGLSAEDVEPFDYPDLPFQTWRYRNHLNTLTKRDNRSYCLDGVRLIYNCMKKLNTIFPGSLCYILYY